MTGASAATDRRRTPIRTIGRTSTRAFHYGVVTALLALALLASACTGVSNPEGWASPQILEGTLYASIESGKMAALDPTPEAGADCENFEDDDGDGGVDEGCERAGQKSESGGDCKNVENDDGQGNNPNDNVVNDGCPPYYAIWTFPPNAKKVDQLDLKGIYSAPLVDGEVVLRRLRWECLRAERRRRYAALALRDR